MKYLVISLLLLFLVTGIATAQVAPVPVIRVEDSTAQFNEYIPKGTWVYNIENRTPYIITVQQGPNNDITDNPTKVRILTKETADTYYGAFNGDRLVTRSGIPNINAGGETVAEFLDNYFFPFLNPTVNCQTSRSIGEYGQNYNATISGNVTMNSETIISDGILSKIYPITVTETTFSDIYSEIITWNPRPIASLPNEAPILRYQASITGTECDCTVTSETVTLQAVYPFLYGMSEDDLESDGALLYSTLTKIIELQGSKTVDIEGDGYIYFAYPSIYSDLTSIKDHNNFEQLGAFTKHTVTVTSSGLSSNWITTYKLYKFNNTTAPPTPWAYQFIF